MSPLFRPTTDPSETTGQRERAKERMYILCQSGSWLTLLGLQVFFTLSFDPKKVRSTDEMVQTMSLVTMIITLGWVISHFTRPLIRRWRWQELGWRALLPRIFATAAVQSALWTGVGFGYPYGLLGIPLPHEGMLWTLVAVSWVNGMIIFAGWLCIYFFYHLFDRYNRLRIEQLRLAAEVKEAELRALKSQVNPHFIFNALNSLRALIDEDPPRARMAVTQLANLLRYSLQSAQAESVAFEDELRVVNDYLALEQVRHEERLKLRLDIAPETLGLAIPPLVLQTLVENAVKYGISPRAEGGQIEVIARCEHGQLRLTVTNPGTLTEPTANGTNGSSTGLGLRNAADRLQLFFGDRATLRVREVAPLVVAEVSIPAQTARR